MANTYERLRADIIVAVKARDTARATALRTADAAIQRAAMDQNQPIEETLVITTLRKAVKNLTDAKADFEKGGRIDLAEANAAEIALLQAYLPQGLNAGQLETAVDEAIRESGATSKREMGKVMAVLKQRPDAGLIDFGAVSKLAHSKLL